MLVVSKFSSVTLYDAELQTLNDPVGNLSLDFLQPVFERVDFPSVSCI